MLEKQGLEKEEDEDAYDEVTNKQSWLYENLEAAFDENKEILI